MLPQWVIEKKRDGRVLSEEEIRFFIDGYTRDEIPDYQMAAMAMAIYLRGMTFEETAILTDAMMRSGDVMDTSSIPKVKVDKHSTGGVGDKVSLILAPLVACCGLAVPMISGRGLGITGGTLDKLESIPGYRTDLSNEEFLEVVNTCGCSIIGQTGQLAPADKKLYALRDVTATVPSIPLITASIMCKKLAEGIDALVLDVKWGRGAFMKTRDHARDLANNLVKVGASMGKGTAALLTAMNQPLGRNAGNAMEVVESVEALRGDGPEDLMEVTLALGAQMLLLGGRAATADQAAKLLNRQLASGAAFEKFLEMVDLQGGDPKTLEDVSGLPSASLRHEVRASAGGVVHEVDAEKVGRACSLLGAGRAKTDDAIDVAAGVSGLCKIGEDIAQGGVLATLHANDRTKMEEAQNMIGDAFVISDDPCREPQRIAETIVPRD